MNKEALGVDIGGVIIDRVGDRTDTSFFADNYLRTTAVPYAFDALRQLAAKRFGDRIFLISKCGQRTQEKTLRWLDHHQFCNITGIGRDHVRFCRERHEKAAVCEELEITHFIDDRLAVLRNLVNVGSLYLFRPRPDEVRQFTSSLSRVRQVNSWQEIVRDLLP